ncbi:hypothetical protein BC835DRAFT_1309014 [Cytidiella melzeri]|nr:hypothetical protein BC835DRAFT_1309014 [Cytidiella melzeri]
MLEFIERRQRINNELLSRVHQVYNLDGFTDTKGPGIRLGSLPLVDNPEDAADAEGGAADDDQLADQEVDILDSDEEQEALRHLVEFISALSITYYGIVDARACGAFSVDMYSMGGSVWEAHKWRKIAKKQAEIREDCDKGTWKGGQTARNGGMMGGGEGGAQEDWQTLSLDRRYGEARGKADRQQGTKK